MHKISQHISAYIRMFSIVALCACALAGVVFLADSTSSIDRAYAAGETQLQSTVTSATLSSGNFSTWLSQPTTVSLEVPGWADATKYRFGSAGFATYDGPLEMTAEGKTSLYFQSSSAESIEPLQTVELWLDFTAPTQPGETVFSQPESDGFAYSFGPSRDALSGVGSYEVTLTSSATSSTVTTQTVSNTSGHISKLAPGTYDLTYAAKDLAGNISEPQTRQVMVGIPKPVLTYSLSDPDYAEKIAQGKWITTGVDVRLNAAIASEAPTTTLKMKTISGSLETTDVARENYGSIPLTLTEQGAGKVVLSATDIYGNNSQETSFTLKVDRIAPSAPSLVTAATSKAVSDDTKTNLVLTWGPSYDAASGIDFYRVNVERSGAGFAGATTIDTKKLKTVITDVEKGDYLITVQAFDKAGLASEEVHIAKGVGAVSASKTPSSVTPSAHTVETVVVKEEGSADSSDAKVEEMPSSQSSDADAAIIDETGDENYAKSTPLSNATTAALVEKEPSLWQKLVDFVRYEWVIWLPIVLSIIAVILLIVAIMRHNRTPDAADGLSQTAADASAQIGADGLSHADFEQKETAQPSSMRSSQLSDQADHYFTINS